MSSDDRFSISGRTAVVTGGCSGIGRVIAEGYAERGARVAVIDVDAPEHAPPGAVHFKADVSDRGQIEKTAALIAERLGHVDILVNNAGINEFGLSIDLSSADWERTLAVNLTGTFNCCQAFARGMINRRRGKIVNLASRCGFVGLPFHPAYNASKAGIISLTQTLAIEWGAFGVMVNAIVPGFVRTNMNKDALADPAVTDVYARKIPLGRISEPGDLLGPAIFLASAASDYVTGSILAADGGNLASGGVGAEIRNEHFRKLGIDAGQPAKSL